MKRRYLALGVLVAGLLVAWWLRPTPAVLPVERAPQGLAERPPLAGPEGPAAVPMGDVAADGVECPLLEEPAMRLSLRIVELDPESMEPTATVDAEIRRGAVRFRPSNADVGMGTLIGDAIEPMVLVWALGVCTEDVQLVLRPHFDVVAMVNGDSDVEDFFVRMRCDTPRESFYEGGKPPGADGALHFQGVLRDSCVLEATRLHGSFRLVLDFPVPTSSEPQELLVDVPPLPATGVAGYAERGGVRIDAIAPGSRGERAGLQLRDLVFPDVPPQDILEWADGDAPIPVVVERDGERFDATI